MTFAEWVAEGIRRFGMDQKKWRFVCPVCKYVATPEEWLAAGATNGMVAFSCIGRNLGATRTIGDVDKPGPCDYAGGGLFGLNPVLVTDPSGKQHQLFAFAEE